MNTPTKKLASDVKIVMSDVEELLKATASQTADKVTEARARAQAAIAQARSAAIDHGKEAARTADQYVHENPWTAIGISAGVGLLVGLLIGRR
jgi:ElaB/YqjD/DUF883 family membrane-anchored ribosome-binding protein